MTFLDWASTSPVIRFTASDYQDGYHNPNAAYAEDARGELRVAESRIKQAIGVEGGHVLYFRCATEAIEWFWSRSIRRGSRAIWWAHSPYEHDCCMCGWDRKPSDDMKGIDFYIHQWVNHVTGEIFNLKEIKAQLPENTRLIVDATAGFGKAKLPRDLESIASALFMSGHKIGCPELSFIWLNDELCEWFGASKDIRNQWGLHHGSLSVASVLALADAVEWANDKVAYKAGVYAGLYRLLLQELSSNDIHGFAINGWVNEDRSNANEPVDCTEAINAIRLNGINADSLQQFLANRNIYIGVGGSACSAAHDYRVLRAYGRTNDEAAEVIRVSFGPETTANDIKALVDGIKEYRRQFC